MGLWQRLRDRAEARDERWLGGQEQHTTVLTYVTVLAGLALVFAVSVGVLVWFRSLELFTGADFDGTPWPWLGGLIELILLSMCIVVLAALLLFAVTGWRRRD